MSKFLERSDFHNQLDHEVAALNKANMIKAGKQYIYPQLEHEWHDSVYAAGNEMFNNLKSHRLAIRVLSALQRGASNAYNKMINKQVESMFYYDLDSVINLILCFGKNGVAFFDECVNHEKQLSAEDLRYHSNLEEKMGELRNLIEARNQLFNKGLSLDEVMAKFAEEKLVDAQPTEETPNEIDYFSQFSEWR